jgi:hypothetical protein
MLNAILRKYIYPNQAEDKKQIIKMGLPPRTLIQTKSSTVWVLKN